MLWLAIAVLLATAAGLVLGRRQVAELQSMVVGGRMGGGCVVAEAVGLVVLAVAIWLLRGDLRQ
jgi:hypothetical protein